ncbi:allergen Tha p 1-like [Bacillus rossius redtenbacheri]|uniref:allergen Tha p 1-like n=1 Tax=Bacillus rossius redtenbacheri TaxID=93214 RepID=UPI002FDDD76D
MLLFLLVGLTTCFFFSLDNDRLFASYQKCIMDEGPCTNDGQLLREAIPDALTNCCAKCNDKQKDGARTVIKHVREQKPDVWVKLTGKYDTDGKYEKQYDKDMKEPDCLTSSR